MLALSRPDPKSLRRDEQSDQVEGSTSVRHSAYDGRIRHLVLLERGVHVEHERGGITSCIMRQPRCRQAYQERFFIRAVTDIWLPTGVTFPPKGEWTGVGNLGSIRQLFDLAQDLVVVVILV
ncbi:hypothetical protein Pcac1_g11215 [Phytophthora cactorum]|nr:hypothetical protein Pcac1_g11215 [Phytophthora cactorum]